MSEREASYFLAAFFGRVSRIVGMTFPGRFPPYWSNVFDRNFLIFGQITCARRYQSVSTFPCALVDVCGIPPFLCIVRTSKCTVRLAGWMGSVLSLFYCMFLTCFCIFCRGKGIVLYPKMMRYETCRFYAR